MRHTLLIIFIFQSTSFLFGQSTSLSESDLDSLYLKTLHSQYDLMLTSGWKYFEINENTNRIKDKVGIDIFKFMSDVDLIHESIKTRKSINFYRVTHKIIAIDTVDINISQVLVRARRCIHFNHGLRFIKANFALSCGGTNGYKPTCRFVFDKMNSRWEILTDE